jgi:glyoxylase-like metal-dependent hydrolase (beta-lactamase superfamily II)
MKSNLCIVAAGLTGLIGISSGVQAQPGFGPPELTLVPVDGYDNIYLIRNQSAGNITVLVGEEGIVLVDTKMAPDHDGVIELVRSVSDAPIKYVIDTHMHPDHVGGNPPLQNIGATIVASENARRIMDERNQPGLPNITLRDTMRIWLDDMPIDLHYFGRAHTDGDVVVYLPEQRVVITGDLFALWPYEAVIDYSAGGSLRDWTRTLDRALGLDFDTVIPGHSGVTDRAMMAGYRDHLAKMQAMVRIMNSQGRSREEIQAVMESEFSWGGLSMRVGLDGIILEMQ